MSKIDEVKKGKPEGIYVRLRGPKSEISDFAYYPIQKANELIEDIKKLVEPEKK